jgi:drug/metabolite transporter (DMT)-like permease
VIAQGLLLFATLAYSTSTLIARGAPPIPPVAFAAGYATVGAVLSWPLALRIDPAGVEAGWTHWAAIAALGLGPSGIAQAIFMALVARAGATFLSLTGYSVPVAGAVFGWVFFGELQSWNAVAAFTLILGGVWMARQGGQARRPG